MAEAVSPQATCGMIEKRQEFHQQSQCKRIYDEGRCLQGRIPKSAGRELAPTSFPGGWLLTHRSISPEQGRTCRHDTTTVVHQFDDLTLRSQCQSRGCHAT